MVDHETKFHYRIFGRVVVSLVAAFAVAACEGSTRPSDPRAAFPFVVQQETVSLSMPAPSTDGRLARNLVPRFERFVADYLNRGRSAMVVGTGSGSSGAANGERTRGLLEKAGLRPPEITVVETLSGAAGEGTVTLSFAALKANAPDCGDFSSSMSMDPSNRPHSDWGCASRRNLGLMVRDPADLQKGQPESGADGARSTNVINTYRTPAGP